MLVVISPAKKLNDPSEPLRPYTQPRFMPATRKLADYMRQLSVDDLKTMMGISDKIASLNYTRFQEFTYGGDNMRENAAMMTFAGDTFIGLNAHNIAGQHYDKFQKKLRILSGLYGVLRPFDAIEPYRLEMGCKIASHTPNNLYDYWRNIIASTWQNDVNSANNIIVNCASKEYFSLVAPLSDAPIIEPVFKIRQGNQYKNPGMFVKRLRGALARYVIEHNCQNPADLHNFSAYDYHYSAQESDLLTPFFVKH